MRLRPVRLPPHLSVNHQFLVTRLIVDRSVHHQEILNSNENSHVLENLDPDTEYDVIISAIYPDESESGGLEGSERTRKQAATHASTRRRPEATIMFAH